MAHFRGAHGEMPKAFSPPITLQLGGQPQHRIQVNPTTPGKPIVGPHHLTQSQSICVICNDPNPRNYGRCKSAAYCSRVYQEADFPSHKLVCKQAANLGARPSEEHKRAIYFPVDALKPEVVWIQCWRSPYGKDMVVTVPFIGDRREDEYIQVNQVRGRQLGMGYVAGRNATKGYCLNVVYRDHFRNKGSYRNQSLENSLGTSGEFVTPCRGPLLVYREIPGERIEDITLSDFRHALDHFEQYRISVDFPNPPPSTPLAVRGARLYSVAEKYNEDPKLFLPGAGCLLLEDVKDLNLHNLRRMCNFALEVLFPKVLSAWEKVVYAQTMGGASMALKQDVLDIITWDNVLMNEAKLTITEEERWAI
ncbi:zinc finger MYND domain-containing protein [Aspergillus mulundensis]|uniref:MYND-type domain-containing protein n=1 Tax=Aspergillus mulundensis TaxID=1810919 RepID=A0A3D8SCU5_9EURO|nr:hypothetical protein DSM5745_04488 [Aspergillus mulundensis]RDW84162.1 hypothetical protein DSM5745_04488 [Aspergillus mulundensis]